MTNNCKISITIIIFSMSIIFSGQMNAQLRNSRQLLKLLIFRLILFSKTEGLKHSLVTSI